MCAHWLHSFSFRAALRLLNLSRCNPCNRPVHTVSLSTACPCLSARTLSLRIMLRSPHRKAVQIQGHRTLLCGRGCKSRTKHPLSMQILPPIAAVCQNPHLTFQPSLYLSTLCRCLKDTALPAWWTCQKTHLSFSSCLNSCLERSCHSTCIAVSDTAILSRSCVLHTRSQSTLCYTVHCCGVRQWTFWQNPHVSFHLLRLQVNPDMLS